MNPHQPSFFRTLPFRAVAIAASAALVLGGTVALAQPAAASPAQPAQVSSVHRHSDPVWFPLHVSSTLGCVGDGQGVNNGPGKSQLPCAHDHQGYFGLNLDLPRGTNPAVYAAGAGQVVGVVSNKACGEAKKSAGNYVAVDHGGGRVSLYEHLQSVSVRVGDLVSAGTQVGRAGNTGAPCAGTAYLDFIVRTSGGGYQDLTQPIRTLKACTSRGVQTWPTALDHRYTSWVQVPYLSLDVPASQDGCGQGTIPTTYGTPSSVRAAGAHNRVTVTWPKSGADAIEVQQQIFRPSSNSYDAPCSPYVTKGCWVGYVQLSGASTQYAARGLEDGRTYRFRISRHSASGWSRPSGWVTAMPKTVPKAPGYRTILAHSNHLELMWSMTSSNKNGSTVLGYQAAIRRLKGAHYTAWSYHRTGDILHYTWQHTRPGTRYQVKVRAISNIGDSAWMPRHSRTTPR